MQINKLNLIRLRNEELFQFFVDFKRLVEESGAGALNIEELFAVFTGLFGKLDTALDYIRKDRHTEKLADTDFIRDSIYYGFVQLARAYLRSMRDNKVQAAKNILIVVNAFGDFRAKPYNEETAAIGNFLDDIHARCAADVELLGASEWVDDLEAVNREFSDLMNIRFDEKAQQEYINLRETRREAEKVYANAVDRIHASITLNGEGTYTSFVNKLNERVAYNKNVIAQRKGRAKAKKEKEDGDS
ncbi:MAG: DUF6261 family protein [Bacteroidales bacterium]|jgi:hypothetical protein|nr:DUF6261 family protein [Bacteroidales bacterium]